MEWQFAVGLILAIPLILFPAAFVWYLNVGGIYQALKAMRAKRMARRVPAPFEQALGKEKADRQVSGDLRK